MIRALRRRHLWMVAILGAAALAILLAALAARPEPAVQEVLPAGAATPPGASEPAR